MAQSMDMRHKKGLMWRKSLRCAIKVIDVAQGM
jgi:hypothetical protein